MICGNFKRFFTYVQNDAGGEKTQNDAITLKSFFAAAQNDRRDKWYQKTVHFSCNRLKKNAKFAPYAKNLYQFLLCDEF